MQSSFKRSKSPAKSLHVVESSEYPTKSKVFSPRVLNTSSNKAKCLELAEVEDDDSSESEDLPDQSGFNETLFETDQLAIKCKEIHDQSVQSVGASKSNYGGKQLSRDLRGARSKEITSGTLKDNIEYLGTGVENMNQIFQDIFSCIRANKAGNCLANWEWDTYGLSITNIH